MITKVFLYMVAKPLADSRKEPNFFSFLKKKKKQNIVTKILLLSIVPL